MSIKHRKKVESDAHGGKGAARKGTSHPPHKHHTNGGVRVDAVSKAGQSKAFSSTEDHMFECVFYCYMIALLLFQNCNIYRSALYSADFNGVSFTAIALSRRLVESILRRTPPDDKKKRSLQGYLDIALVFVEVVFATYCLYRLSATLPLRRFMFVLHPVIACCLAFGQGFLNQGTTKTMQAQKLLAFASSGTKLNAASVEIPGKAMQSVLEGALLNIAFEGTLHGYLVGFLPLKLVTSEYFHYSIGHCISVKVCAIVNTVVLLLLREIKGMGFDAYHGKGHGSNYTQGAQGTTEHGLPRLVPSSACSRVCHCLLGFQAIFCIGLLILALRAHHTYWKGYFVVLMFNYYILHLCIRQVAAMRQAREFIITKPHR